MESITSIKNNDNDEKLTMPISGTVHLDLWLWVVVTVAGLCVGQDRPIVNVNEGRIIGQKSTEYNVTFLEFLSIPYAKPPIGEKRFKDPEPIDPWVGDIDASQLPSPCDQLAVMGNEDCLYINVYTPENALEIDYPIPVMVYIHGGGFATGSANKYHGYQPLIDKGVIVAMMQYRLGIFGFLSTEDEVAPGNQGLKDQTLALQWIKNNIAAFGGDPQRITIFGGSAGSASVHYQMLAPSAAGLFTGAIMESGSALCPWARGRDFLWAAQSIAQKFDCPIDTSDVLIECLQGVGAHLLDSSYASLMVWNVQPFYFAPRIDGVYIPDEPVRLLKNGQYHKVPVIMGINRDELALETVEMYAVPSLIESLIANFTINGPVSLELYPEEDPVNTATIVYDKYLGGLNFEKENVDNLTQMYTDGLFLVRHDWTVSLMSHQSPVFAYELHHRGQNSVVNKFLNTGLDLPQANNYIAHSDDKQYQFLPGYANLTTTDDVTVGHLFTTMWTDFATTWNPTPDGSLGFNWIPTNPNNLDHLKILPQPYMETDQRATVREFWESLPLIINDLLNE